MAAPLAAARSFGAACFVLVAACLAPSEVRAQNCSGTVPPDLGTVTALRGPCPSGPGLVPNTTCRLLEVECGGLDSLTVQLRITPPNPVVAERGTVVFGSGGDGGGFYSGQSNAHLLLQDLVGLGFRVIERAWPPTQGWMTFESGLRRESCRYATLLTWIRDSLHVTGAFVVTGNSGGSGELCYALTSWSRGDIVDLAVPSGGPPLARLDYQCGRVPEWPAQCQAIVPNDSMDCAPGCSVGPNHYVCQQCGPAPTAQELFFDSALHPDAVVAYPRTRVHFIFGRQDCSSAVPNGLLWHDAIPTDKALRFVPNTPHFVAGSAEGRDAILRAILQGTAGPVSVGEGPADRGAVDGRLRMTIGPNPSVGPVSFRFTLPRAGFTKLDLLTASGRIAATLCEGNLPAGDHVVTFDPDASTSELPAGVYFYRLAAASGSLRGALVRIRSTK